MGDDLDQVIGGAGPITCPARYSVGMKCDEEALAVLLGRFDRSGLRPLEPGAAVARIRREALIGELAADRPTFALGQPPGPIELVGD